MTLPIRHGPSIAIRIITITFVLLILFTLLPYVFKVYGLVYLLLVVPGVDAYLVYVLVSLRRNPTQSNYRRLSRGLKLNMLMGLLAILAGVKL
jgi:4-hydroxybenzoate polyprenyltransferase